MELKRLTGSVFRAMVAAAASNLENNKAEVNTLNVFPVPDGDTGTNMGLTLLAAAKAVEGTGGERLDALAEAAAKGSLMGARGNSGVILSQFFRGLARGLAGLETAGPKEVARALRASSDTAYKAVIKPVEGTMLTVGRFGAEAAEKAARHAETVNEVLIAAVNGAREGLEKTPSMLPVLAEAGVVDAGGYGIVVALEGALKALHGEAPAGLVETGRRKEAPRAEGSGGGEYRGGITAAEDIKFKYCTEFLVRGENLDTASLRARLEPLGDSLLVVGAGDTVKVHVHTNTPGEALNICGELGDLLEIDINNMVEQNRQAARQHQQTRKAPEPAKQVAVVAVCVGQGLQEIFKSLGADKVVTGGQTMNPSTEDLLTAVKETNAPKVVLLPNNKNIIFAAEQVKHLTNQEVHIIPTRTIPQGIGALMAYAPDREMKELVAAMSESARAVRTGEVTYAVRSTSSNGLEINERDFIGLTEGEIKAAGKEINEVLNTLVDNMVDDDTEIITLYYGEDISESKAEEMQAALAERHPDCEVEYYYGGQPLYYYLIAVE